VNKKMTARYGIMGQDGNILETWMSKDVASAKKRFNEIWRHHAHNVEELIFFKFQILSR